MRTILITIFLQPLTILGYVLIGSICLDCKCKEMKHLKSGILPIFFPLDSFKICVSTRGNAGLTPHRLWKYLLCH